MNKGSIQQVASTTEIYERPANDFVADFVGESNIFHGTVTEVGSVTLRVRPSAADHSSGARSAAGSAC